MTQMYGPEGRELRRVAYQEVNKALRRKTLVRQSCEVCDDPFSHAHHRWGYAVPLRVVWLCAPHHEEEHRQMRAAQPRPPYREMRFWQYSEGSTPTRVADHIDRLFTLLNDHERRRILRKLAALLDQSKEQTA